VADRISGVRRAEATVDLDAVRANITELRRRAGSAQVMAIVKADGYGHGAVQSARAALSAGASWLGVALVEEALALRAAGISEPLLVLLPPMEQVAAALTAGVDLTVHSVGDLQRVAAAAAETGLRARIQLKVDSGLGRGGQPAREWSSLLDATTAAADQVQVVGVWSHLACSDRPAHPSIASQLTTFRDALDVAKAAGLSPEVVHLSNSGGLLGVPDARFDLVRPGIATYGLSPGPEHGTARELGLRPAMTLRAAVALVKRLPAGHGIGYGHRYTTTTETSTAVIPLGYADGIPRAATGVAPLWLAGRRRTIAGTVSMDQVVVDIGEDDVSVGDEALLFGPGDQGEPTADDWGSALGTIGYEIVTRIGPRVPRRYLGES
jgi:alanine racemase